ncbi:hypothetical protein EW146_g5946 [Bondarzewia mesenterica]|uniref:Uncharacterized protein n=1 Tax=Bondarzewia mesenterica TaxID=1095465 RepID=A0A4S4LRU4_9AGAM|nr:hypothetical protein EW146_g5946 [Bondarzewia mesenterica]
MQPQTSLLIVLLAMLAIVSPTFALPANGGPLQPGKSIGGEGRSKGGVGPSANKYPGKGGPVSGSNSAVSTIFVRPQQRAHLYAMQKECGGGVAGNKPFCDPK